MRKFLTAAAVFSLLLLMFAVHGRAQEESGDTPMHPAIGSWRLAATDADGQLKQAAIIAFHSDGTVIEIDGDGTWWLGAWEATGPKTASYTLESVNADGSGMSFSQDIEIAPSGESWLPPQGQTLGSGEGAFRILVGALQPGT